MKVKRFSALLAITLVLTFAMDFPVWSQQDKKTDQNKKADEDAIRISTELVQMDVLVTDKNNKPVTGLKREDFELYDNDKLQAITHFSYEESKSRRVADEQGSSMPRVITPGELNRVVAFVIDTLHMKPENVYRARRMLQDFVDTKMAPGDLVLILPTAGGSGLYQQFTTDQRVLRNAISQLRPAFILDNDTPARRAGQSQQVLELLPALAEGRANVPQAEGQGGTGTGSNIVTLLEEADVRATLNALNTLIASMGRLPGRKISVFISEGFRSLQAQMSSELSETINRAARANVVFYSVAAGGLEPLSGTASDVKGDLTDGPIQTDALSPTGLAIEPTRPDLDARSNSDRRRDVYESLDSLNALAVDTGGKFLRNTNDIKTGLNTLLEENAGYYLLGFQPDTNKWDGKFHRIKVVVRGRPDLNVSTRKGYMAKTEKPKDKSGLSPKAAEIMEAINSPLVRRDIDLQLTAFYRDDSKREPVMTGLLHIDAGKLNFKQEGGKYKTKLDITGFVLDAVGRPIDTFATGTELNLDPQLHQALLKDGILTVRGAAVKPGAYQIKVLVREADSGFIGTASTYLEIPDLKADRLALSSIFTDARLLQQDKSATATTSQSSTLSQRRFPRNGEFAYIVIAYNAKEQSGKPQLEMVTRILKGGRVVFNGQPKPVEILEGSTPPSRIITGGIMQLGGLKPDQYTLEVTVVDKLRKKEGNIARQEIDFSIQ